MCLVSPGRVVALDGSTATLEVDGRRREASVLLEPDVAVGDWVVVVAGAVVRRIEPRDALDMQAAFLAATTPLNADPDPGTTGGRHHG